MVPCAFVLLGWAMRAPASGDASALTLLHAVQLPLWPMSKLFLDDATGGRHWLYLPLAAVLSNALIYVAVGLVAVWGRTRGTAGLAATACAAWAILAAGWQGFGTSGTGFVIAALAALAGIMFHHRIAR